MGTKILGSGTPYLLDYVRRCENAGGTLLIRTDKNGAKFTNRVLIGCKGAKKPLRAGFATKLQPELVKTLRKALGNKKEVPVSEIRTILGRYIQNPENPL